MYKFAFVLVKGAAFAFLAVASANASWQADCINPGICSTRICVATRERALWRCQIDYGRLARSDQGIKLHATLRALIR